MPLVTVARPAARTARRDLPLGVADPAAATGHTRRQRERHVGAFEADRHPDGAAAREAVEDRTVYGAAIVTPHPGPAAASGSARRTALGCTGLHC
ncbi:hypothetical protein [Streptomyces avermitilis]|uniref:hypothetical protein n=1 Tax=Streptomyces avermitilis TaxID=33903 RepID=UPI0037FBF69A